MSRKRILIDGFNLALEAGTGVATYARNLSQGLRALDHEIHVLYGLKGGGPDPLLREVAFFDQRQVRGAKWLRWFAGARDWFTAHLGVRPVAVPVSGAVIVDQFQSNLPAFDQLWNSPNLFARAHAYHRYFFDRRLEVRMDPAPQIAHWTYPLPLQVRGAKNIYTLHDLVPLRLPFTTLDVKRNYYRLVKMVAARADHIVTVSENSRRDIVQLLGVPESKVTNTYQAVEIPQKHAAKSEEVVRRELKGAFGLDWQGYFLFYGAIEPKKNIGRLIEAYLASGVEARLVIVGKPAWLAEQELRLLKGEHPGSRRIVRIDYAPYSLLVSLIRGAKALLFPSLYEGFGLPVLESMQLGTPVLTSDVSCLPEVAGEAAMYVNPYDAAEIAEGIRALDADPGLRAELSEQGRRQAAKFSMQNYQKRLGELYAALA